MNSINSLIEKINMVNHAKMENILREVRKNVKDKSAHTPRCTSTHELLVAKDKEAKNKAGALRARPPIARGPAALPNRHMFRRDV